MTDRPGWFGSAGQIAELLGGVGYLADAHACGVLRLAGQLGKPVLVNNAVSLWAGLRLLKRNDSIQGYGRLLRDHLAA